MARAVAGKRLLLADSDGRQYMRLAVAFATTDATAGRLVLPSTFLLKVAR